MTEPSVYPYDIHHEDGWWIVAVPQLGLTTQARHLRDTDRMAKSIISLHLDISPDHVDVRRSNIVGLPQRVADAVEEANAARGRLSDAQETSGEATRRAAREMVRAGVPLRDAGYLLGLSHQRIAQLVAPGDARVERRGKKPTPARHQ
ncbi:MAG TPA: hypothetical protein VK277_10555 [Acidimicrobiales bacterium]|nr:hypothetical protein [Acidimicrobiales bacterium]